jgi:hypothetical protein
MLDLLLQRITIFGHILLVLYSSKDNSDHLCAEETLQRTFRNIRQLIINIIRQIYMH